MKNFRLFFAALLAGLCGTQTVCAQNWTGTTPAAVMSATDTKAKTVFLWNVGQHRFLGAGSLWGTQAVMANEGTPFTMDASGYLVSDITEEKNGTGTSNGYLAYANGINLKNTGLFFLDASITSRLPVSYTAVSGKTNVYTIAFTSSNTKYYLSYVADSTQLRGTTTAADENAQWILVPLSEREQYFAAANASTSSAVPGTFLVHDYEFARKNTSVTQWQTQSTSTSGFDGTLTNGTTLCTPDSARHAEHQVTYYTYTYTGHCSGSTILGGAHDVTKTVTTTTPPAEQQQTITEKCGTNHGLITGEKNVTLTLSTTTSEIKTVVDRAGYQYYVGNGYPESEGTIDDDRKNVASYHYQETYGGDWTANIHGAYGVVNETLTKDEVLRKGWYRVSCVGFTTAESGKAVLYAAAGTHDSGDGYKTTALTHITEAPATYIKAARLINGAGYESSVMVYVGENETLSFGIYVNGAEATDWTCFDNINLSYLGDPETTLFLDEEQTSVDYINAQLAGESDNVQRTLYLHRTMNVGKWNSIVLPVSLTVGQVQSAFGDATKVSEYKGATDKSHPNRIYFTDVNISRDHENEVAIQAGHLYIIKPTTAQPENQTERTFPGDAKYTSYYTLQQVVLPNETIQSARIEEEAHTATAGNSEQVKFCGTYVKVTGADAIPANSYVLNGNNQGGTAGLWYFRTVTTNSKGFRGWLEQTKSGEQKASFVINGIGDDATAIDGITADETTAAQHQGVYNLNGQRVSDANSLEGLARGIYIMGGKKYVVK